MYTYIDPAKNNYPGLDRGFNQRFKLDNGLSNNNKEGVYLAYNSQDILDILDAVVDGKDIEDLSGQVRITSGGHCYENFVFQSQEDNPNSTRYVIDLCNMRGIYEEVIDGTVYAVIEAGASNWLIQQTLHSVYGAAVPGGSCYSVCAGGHIAGGGYGLLSRLHGLTVDYLAGVELVIYDSKTDGFKIRKFDGKDSDQLDWANRGAGAGHFGVITKYYFPKDKLPPAPESALLIILPVPWKQFLNNKKTVDTDKFHAFMQAYYEACKASAPQAFHLGKFTCMSSPEDIMNIIMQVVYGNNSGHDSKKLGGYNIPPLWTKDAARQVINKFSSALSKWIAVPETSVYHKQLFSLPGHPIAGTAALDMIYDLPWIDMTQLLNGSGENQCGKYKSSSMITNFTMEESAAIAAFLTDTQAGNPAPKEANKAQTLIQIDSYGEQINAMDTDGDPTNTVIGARSSILKLQYQSYWKNHEGIVDPAKTEQEIVSWFNTGYNYIHSEAQGNVNNSGFPLWGEKYQACYFNYPDRQVGVNAGYQGDPGQVYGDFMEIYFGAKTAEKLKEIKTRVDPKNFFAFAQSIPLIKSK